MVGQVGQAGLVGQVGQVGQVRRVGRVALLGLGLALALRSLDVHGADNARQIVDEAQKRTEAKSQRYEGLLQVFDAKGKISDKRWTFERLGSHGLSKSVLRFTAPAEVKGVALLVVNHPDRASDQWMWTPGIERDRRIALQDRSTRFFGTDFSFEDLEERDVNQYEYTLVGEETVDGAPCWKIQSTPRQSKGSQYTRSVVWIRKDNYAFARIESYVKDQAARRLNYSGLQNVQGIWTAKQLEMTDIRRGSRTRLTLDKLEYNVPLEEADFTLQAIRRQ
jgi:outer membrane lipoprotein-sorting protein